ncbi:WW domain-binding protein 2 [Echinococcus granulosus]|uniref:WW domain binding protein 2 n=2 Tax=Echinococcus granulosus TaxID=6210 RepID=A0A068WZ08_ECHGR|nr:WW domain-binding protein 2 [Echinococcus granulosus]CDS22911.1 WW domain binding protein 2 [Echinococcus granulosus]
MDTQDGQYNSPFLNPAPKPDEIPDPVKLPRGISDVAVVYLPSCIKVCVLCFGPYSVLAAMSINTAHTQDGLGVVLFYGERLLITYDGCKLTLSGSGQQPNGRYSGTAYLTSHRVIFLSKDKSPTLNSLSMAFIYMRRVAIKQPTFGPNHIEGFVLSESGQWAGEMPFKLAFNHGGAIEFGKSLLELGTRASKLQNSYETPVAPPLCEIYACPPPAYTPFVNDPYYNSFMQVHPSFSPPPVEFLYQTNSPPPYPGAVPPPYTPNPGPPPPYTATAASPMPPYPVGGPPPVNTGYYYPSDPNTFYAPPYSQASAPPMEPEDKKNL